MHLGDNTMSEAHRPIQLNLMIMKGAKCYCKPQTVSVRHNPSGIIT